MLTMTRTVNSNDAASAQPDHNGILNSQQQLQLLEVPAAVGRSRRTPSAMEALHNATLVQLPLGVGYARRDGTFIWCNTAFEKMLGLVAGEFRQKTIRELTHSDDLPGNDRMLADLWEGRIKSYSLEKRYIRRNGAELWVNVTASMLRVRGGQPICSVGFLEDITARKNMQAEVERVQEALVQASRQAGMAEVATNVLHNVGNVLNSVNVSASIVADRIKGSKGTRLAEVAALLEENQADLPYFFGQDERGRKLPRYLAALAEQLASERDSLLKELNDLRANLDHIREAVSLQQTHARRGGLLETVSVVDLVEDSLRMNVGALTRHRVTLERDYRDRPGITVERHKVLQVLVNVIANAKYACDESGRDDRQVVVRIETVAEGVSIAVLDNGVGITPEVMRRLFTHRLHHAQGRSWFRTAQRLAGCRRTGRHAHRRKRRAGPRCDVPPHAAIASGGQAVSEPTLTTQQGLLSLNRRVLVIDDNPSIHADFRKVLNTSPVEGGELLDMLEAEVLGAATQVASPQFDLDVAFQGEEGVEKARMALQGGPALCAWRSWTCACRRASMDSRPSACCGAWMRRSRSSSALRRRTTRGAKWSRG